MRKTSVLIIIFAILYLFAACGNATPGSSAAPNNGGSPTGDVNTDGDPSPDVTEPDEIKLSDLNKYRIVYPRTYNDYQLEDVYALRDAISAAAGFEIEVVSDEEPAEAYEIILAGSERSAITENMPNFENSMDYMIAVSDGNIVLGGRDYYSDLRAIYRFINDYIGYDDVRHNVKEQEKSISGYATYIYEPDDFAITAVNLGAAPFTEIWQAEALKSADFNTVIIDSDVYTEEQLRNFMKWCVRYGINVILRGTLYMEVYFQCPVVRGHCIVDEPYGESSFEYYSQMCDDYMEAYADFGWKPYVNMMGQLDVMEYFTEHKEYFASADILSFDCKFFGEANTYDFLQKYELFANEAKNTGKLFWASVQSPNSYESYSKNMLAWMANIAVCFGANGVQYCNYGAYGLNSDFYSDGSLLRDDFTPTPTWYAAKSLNSNLAAFSELRKDYEYDGTYLIGDGETPAYAEFESEYTGFSDISISVDEESEQKHKYIVGCFEGDDNKYAFSIINAEAPDDANIQCSNTILLRINTVHKVTCFIDGQVTELYLNSSGCYSLTLEQGQSAFIMIEA